MWVKLDDGFHRNPKIRWAGRDCRDMHLAAICYANHNETLGFIPEHEIDLIAVEAGVLKVLKPTIKKLLTVFPETGNPLWYQVEGGYLLHDYENYQPTKTPEEIEQLKKDRSNAGKIGAKARWEKVRQAQLTDNNLLDFDNKDDDKPDSNLLQNHSKTHGKKMPPYPVSRILGKEEESNSDSYNTVTVTPSVSAQEVPTVTVAPEVLKNSQSQIKAEAFAKVVKLTNDPGFEKCFAMDLDVCERNGALTCFDDALAATRTKIKSGDTLIHGPGGYFQGTIKALLEARGISLPLGSVAERTSIRDTVKTALKDFDGGP